MVTMRGKSESGADRNLELRIENDGKAYLWIYTPNGDDKSGYSIYVDARQLGAKLVEAAIGGRTEKEKP